MVNFKVNKKDALLIGHIAKRAWWQNLAFGDYKSLAMDITACHANGNPLKLGNLLDAEDHDFGHDLNGIQKHIDRDTGELMGCFSPRFSR